jgi:hypothetical protein
LRGQTYAASLCRKGSMQFNYGFASFNLIWTENCAYVRQPAHHDIIIITYSIALVVLCQYEMLDSTVANEKQLKSFNNSVTEEIRASWAPESKATKHLANWQTQWKKQIALWIFISSTKHFKSWRMWNNEWQNEWADEKIVMISLMCATSEGNGASDEAYKRYEESWLIKAVKRFMLWS